MEDPWSSPWASVPAAESPPASQLPSRETWAGLAPQPGVENVGDSLTLPPEAGLDSTPRLPVPSSPGWGDDEADEWGGWSDVSAKNRGWGRSLGDDAWVSNGWPNRKGNFAEQEDERKGTTTQDKRVVDSAISFGPTADSPIQQSTLSGAAENIWSNPSPLLSPTAPVIEVDQHPAARRRRSPCLEPPGEATGDAPVPGVVRKSSKVQELVEMYDGISKGSVSPASPASLSEPKTLPTLSADDSSVAEEQSVPSRKEPTTTELEFQEPACQESSSAQDLEIGCKDDAQEEILPDSTTPDELEFESDEMQPWGQEDTLSQVGMFSPAISTKTSVTQGENQCITSNDHATRLCAGDDSDDRAASTDGPAKEKTTSSDGTTGQDPTLSYPVELTHLDSLFPPTNSPFPPPENLPDSLLTDSFTTVEQRKVWYRISRFGSLRKHNHADDDTYVRTNWTGSQVRYDTLKIVRRWMEEDSFDGKARLGRNRAAAGGTHMFGWDSTAPEVGIGELLANKARRASRGANLTIKAPELASFGWGSAPSPSTTDSPVEMLARTNGFATSPREVQQLSVPEIATTVVHAPVPQPSFEERWSTSTRPSTGVFEDQGEDDDGWGEMVTSPSVATPRDPSSPDDFRSLTFTSPPQTRTSLPFSDRSYGMEPWSKPQLDGSHSRPISFGTTVPKIHPTNPDPGAFGDVSMLDQTPKKTSFMAPRPPAAKASLPPVVPIGFSMEPLQPTPSPVAPHFSKPSTPVPSTLTPTTSLSPEPAPGSSAAAQELTEVEDSVRRIISNLPDLSYMLR